MKTVTREAGDGHNETFLNCNDLKQSRMPLHISKVSPAPQVPTEGIGRQCGITGERRGVCKPTFAAVVKRTVAKSPAQINVAPQKAAKEAPKMVDEGQRRAVNQLTPTLTQQAALAGRGDALNKARNEDGDKRNAMQRLAGKVMLLLRRGIKQSPPTCEKRVELIDSRDDKPPEAKIARLDKPEKETTSAGLKRKETAYGGLVLVPVAERGRRIVAEKKQRGKPSIKYRPPMGTRRPSPYGGRICKCVQPLQPPAKQQYCSTMYLVPHAAGKKWTISPKKPQPLCHMFEFPFPRAALQATIEDRNPAHGGSAGSAAALSFYYPRVVQDSVMRIHKRYGHLTFTDEFGLRKEAPRECERCNTRRLKPAKPTAGMRRARCPPNPAPSREAEPYEEEVPAPSFLPQKDALNRWSDEFRSQDMYPPRLFIHSYHWAIRMVFVALDLHEGRMACQSRTIIA